MNISIYTDGACSGNPGIGGWGAVILSPNEKILHLSGGELDTTNSLTGTFDTINWYSENKYKAKIKELRLDDNSNL